jgi:uncharacterized SAM-binding protein YcdF (DUF218 family)
MTTDEGVDLVAMPTSDAAPSAAQSASAAASTSRRGRRWHRRLFRELALMVAGGVLVYGFNLYQVMSTARSDQARPVDAIVVMGAAQYDGVPSPQLAARLDQVVALWQTGITDVVVVTGGKQEGDRFTEAAASARYLEERGIPASAILQETQGRNSYRSIEGAAALLRERSLRTVLLVSDPFHSLRIKKIAEEFGLRAYVSPTRTSPVRGLTAFRHELEEAGGVMVGRIIGFRRLLSITG